MKYKILDYHWRSALHTVGFVAYATENPGNPGEWNSVVGYIPEVVPVGSESPIGSFLLPYGGQDEEIDLQYIAAHGAKLEWEVAQVMFPNLDITKHKYKEKLKEL